MHGAVSKRGSPLTEITDPGNLNRPLLSRLLSLKANRELDAGYSWQEHRKVAKGSLFDEYRVGTRNGFNKIANFQASLFESQYSKLIHRSGLSYNRCLWQ